MQLTLSALALLALAGLPFVKVAPNRLLSGEPLFFLALIPGPLAAPAGLLFGLLVVNALAALGRGASRALAASVAAASLLA
ncbi:MAG: ABC transporter permease, partial [Polaromonas sp.]|nr:ABC transporter permease [Polaromonas sp.]